MKSGANVICLAWCGLCQRLQCLGPMGMAKSSSGPPVDAGSVCRVCTVALPLTPHLVHLWMLVVCAQNSPSHTSIPLSSTEYLMPEDWFTTETSSIAIS